MKIGFIGSGNMATAIIQGILAKNFISADQVYVTDIDSNKIQKLAKQTGIHAVKSNTELTEKVDTILLAVKPNVVPIVLTEIKELLAEKKILLISIAAGTTLSQLAQIAGSDAKIATIRVMPNVNAMIGEGVAAVCGNDFTTHEQVATVIQMFQAVGTAYELNEKDFSNFTALAGSSPAYAYLFIDAMARAGVKNGLPKDLATEICAQAVLGSAKMILASEGTPWDLIDKVCSPGGTTIAGLVALEDEKFISTVIKGIDATIQKDQDLMNKKR